VVGHFSKPYVGAPSNPTHHLMPALYKVSKNTQPLYITLNMASAVFAEKLDDFQDLIQLIHKSSHCTLNSSCKKPNDKNSCLVFEMCME
jgi:hypothetical protein